MSPQSHYDYNPGPYAVTEEELHAVISLIRDYGSRHKPHEMIIKEMMTYISPALREEWIGLINDPTKSLAMAMNHGWKPPIGMF